MSIVPGAVAARRTLATLAACAVALLLIAALAAASANAVTDNWVGRNLPGYNWTGSGYYAANLWWEGVEAETSSSVCVGPVQKSGGGWIAPYGWTCGRTSITWNHPLITGMAAVYNPNPGTIPYFKALAYYG
jgi:hypothetical protein